MNPELSIIIVNWNGRKLLEDCLNSVSNFPPSCNYELIVIDNDSHDDSVAWLEKKKSELGDRLILILNNENVGFGRANNQGMSVSKAKYFFLLNSDAFVSSNAIDKLLEDFDRDPKIGVVAPKLLNADMTLQPSVYRNPPTAWEILVIGLRLYKLMPRKIRSNLLLGPFWPHNERKRVRFASGAALLLRREVYDEVSGFDSSFYMYGEDQEYNLRIIRAGWQIVFCPSAEVVHLGAKSTIARWGQTERNTKFLAGYLHFQELSLTKLELILNCIAAVFVILLEKFWRSILRRPSDDIDASFQVYLRFLRVNLRFRDQEDSSD